MSEIPGSNHENELRLGLVNDVLDRITTMVGTNSRSHKMDVHQADYGLNTNELSEEQVSKYQKIFRDSLTRVTEKWLDCQTGPPILALPIDTATMELLQTPDNEYASLVKVTTMTGGVNRYGLLRLQDDGLDYLCTVYVDETGRSKTMLNIEMPKDDYFKSMTGLLRPNLQLLEWFIHIHYGNFDPNNLENAFAQIRRMVVDDVGEHDADAVISELRNRHKIAYESTQLRIQMADYGEMSDMDLIRLCDMLNQRTAS